MATLNCPVILLHLQRSLPLLAQPLGALALFRKFLEHASAYRSDVRFVRVFGTLIRPSHAFVLDIEAAGTRDVQREGADRNSPVVQSH
jgi:hypothetical protein